MVREFMCRSNGLYFKIKGVSIVLLLLGCVLLGIGSELYYSRGNQRDSQTDKTSGKLAHTAIKDSDNKRGDVIIVDDDGGQDFETIQAAVDAANPGDIIKVWAGRYEEKVMINKTLTLIGEGLDTIINGGDFHEGATIHIAENYVNISGFNITEGSNGITIEDANYCQVVNNTFSSYCGGSHRFFAIEIISGSNNHIYYNRFYGEGDNSFSADLGNDNKWNTSTKGNYWSSLTTPDNDGNGIVDYTYGISGTAGNKDFFPLVKPIHEIFPIADAGSDIQIDQHQTAFLNSSKCWGGAFISNYTWNFTYDNKPRFLYGFSPQFQFHISGSYLIHLVVLSCFGSTTNDTTRVNVRDITTPVAYAGEDIFIDQHENAYLNASKSHDNVKIVQYVWTFYYANREIVLNDMIANFTFDISDIYTITLNVSDNNGNSAVDTLNVTVRDISPPQAEAGNNLTIREHDAVQFEATLSYDNVGICNYSWTFNYNNVVIVLYGQHAEFVFSIPGIYTILLRISDFEGNWGTDSIVVTVLDITPPIADAGNDQIIVQNNTVTFNALNSSDNTAIENYSWSFVYKNENIQLYGGITHYKFRIPGVYNITLMVMDIEGNADDDSLKVFVKDIEKPVAIIIPGNEDVGEGDTVIFDARFSKDNVGVENYTWSISQAENHWKLFGERITFTFLVIGDYNITLTVLDAEGNMDTVYLKMKIMDMEDPFPVITSTGNSFQTGTMVSFIGSDSSDNDGIMNYTWMIRGNTINITLYGEEIHYIFNDPGSYHVILIVSDHGGNSATTERILEIVSDNNGGPKSDEGNGTGNERSFFNGRNILVGGIVIVLFLIAIFAVITFRKRNKNGAKETTPSSVVSHDSSATGGEITFSPKISL